MVAPPPGTRQRLLDAGMRLFATRGFKATTVGEIEAAAGLQPRRGALYKHVASKEALLDAAVAQHLESVAIGAAQAATVSFAALSADELELARPVIVEIGRWFLSELDRQEAMTRILEREGERVEHLRTLARERIVEPGYAVSTGHVRAVAPDADAEALAVVMLASLAGLRRTTWTFGAPPAGVDDERAVEAWADMCMAVLRSLRAPADPPGRPSGS